MRILYVVGGLPFGGIENLLFDICRRLQELGVRFKVVNLSGTGQKLPEFIEARIPIVNLGSRLKDIKTFSLPTAVRLKRLVEEEGASVVHSMQFSGDYFSRLALLFNRGVKVVTHIHNIKREKRFERRLFNRLLSYRTDAFLSVSKAVYDYVEREHNLFKRPNYVFYNCINPERLKPRPSPELAFLKGKRVFLCLGRLVPQKRYDVAIRALKLISGKHPDAVLAVVGEGGEMDRLKELTRSLSLEGRVFFLGYRKDVASVLSLSYALLVPSEYEGLSIAHLEAAYFGLPAVITPAVPSKEILSEASIVVPSEVDSFARAMDRLLSEPKLYFELSERARAVASGLTVDRYVGRLLNFYDSLLSGKLPRERVLF
ncbi:glycosyltransferase [Thermovibrio ammonificans]